MKIYKLLEEEVKVIEDINKSSDNKLIVLSVSDEIPYCVLYDDLIGLQEFKFINIDDTRIIEYLYKETL